MKPESFYYDDNRFEIEILEQKKWADELKLPTIMHFVPNCVIAFDGDGNRSGKKNKFSQILITEKKYGEYLPFLIGIEGGHKYVFTPSAIQEYVDSCGIDYKKFYESIE